MTPIRLNEQITLNAIRCGGCHRYYAAEARMPATCPSCACERIDELYNRIEQQGNQINGLKGALTRAKRRNLAARVREAS